MANGLQGIEVRKKSIRISWTGPDGHDKATLKLNGTALLPTQSNLKYAARISAQIRAAIAAGTFSRRAFFPDDAPIVSTTLQGQLEGWLTTQRLEVSTLRAYRSAVRFWSEGLEGRSLAKLKPSDVRAALNSRPISPKTANNYLSVLSGALDSMVEDGLILTNPCASIASLKHQRPEPEPFSQAEVEAILADMRGHYDATVADYTEFRFFTGLRPSEAAALTWLNVNLSVTAHISIQSATVEGVEKSTTKTKTARTVLLNSRALAAITRQQARTRLAGGIVWLDPRRGAPWSKVQFFQRWYWAPTLRRLGLRYREPYHSRHTYATLMLMAGMTPAFCARQLGHSVEIFLRTYSRWLDGAADAMEMARLEAACAKFSPDFPQNGVSAGAGDGNRNRQRGDQ